MPSGVPRPLLIVILDGWGISALEKGNAIAAANTPTMDLFAQNFPTAALQAAGVEVGLPWGEVGNSETGHGNIGSGRVEYQTLPVIDQTIQDGSFFKNEVLTAALEHVSKNKSQLHLVGLASPGGVHSHLNHLLALLKLVKQAKLSSSVWLHLFTDGRDSPPQGALTYLKQVETALKKYGVGQIASISGRLYAMDRNNNWERTRQVYEMLVGGQPVAGAPTAEEAIRSAYDQGLDDEHIPVTAITQGGMPLGNITANDAVIFFNFRPDRARQLALALVAEKFTGFKRQRLSNLFLAAFTRYDPALPAAAFEQEPAKEPLAKVLSDAGLSQLHITESEKYAHLTYYLNGGNIEPYPREDRIHIPSLTIANFAAAPRLKAEEITNQILAALGAKRYEVYFINYGNADMLGHTGDYQAAVRACAFVDVCLKRLYKDTMAVGGAMLVTSDHGNAEEMLNPQTGEVEKDHTSNNVPIHYVLEELRRTIARSEREVHNLLSAPIGALFDVGPTILDILGIPKPAHMHGLSLLKSLQ